MKEIQLQTDNSVYVIPVQALEHAIVMTTDADAKAVAAKLSGDDAGAHALAYLSWPEVYVAAEPYFRWVTGEQIDLSHKVVANARAKLTVRVGEE